jgi:hypothetical protein
LESALILFLTPNIETLALNCCPALSKAEDIGLEWARREPQQALLPILHAAQGIPYGRVHQFKNLKTLEIRMLGLHINPISPILRLESLCSLTLYEYGKFGFNPNEPPCELMFSETFQDPAAQAQ